MKNARSIDGACMNCRRCRDPGCHDCLMTDAYDGITAPLSRVWDDSTWEVVTAPGRVAKYGIIPGGMINIARVKYREIIITVPPSREELDVDLELARVIKVRMP